LADPAPLSPASQRALERLVWALLPPAPAPHPDDIEARIALQVRRMLQYMPPAIKLGFVALVHALDWSPLWRLRRCGNLASLAQGEASALLAGVAASRFLPLRLMMFAPKAVVLSAYFDQDEVHGALDYEPRGFLRERRRRHLELVDARGDAREQNQNIDARGRDPQALEVLP
jgi:hypothetical protein